MEKQGGRIPQSRRANSLTQPGASQPPWQSGAIRPTVRSVERRRSMRRVLLPVVSALVVLGPLSVAAAADADVKAVLDKAIKAHGGEEAIGKYQATRAVNKGKLTLPGLGEVEFTQEMALMHPDKFRDKLDF